MPATDAQMERRRTWHCKAVVTIVNPETSTFVGLDAEFEFFTTDGHDPTQQDIEAVVVHMWEKDPHLDYPGYGVFSVKHTLTEIP